MGLSSGGLLSQVCRAYALGAAHHAPRTRVLRSIVARFAHDLATATRQDYRKILDRVWLPALADRPIGEIRYSDVVAAFAAVKAGGKARNNNLIPCGRCSRSP
jgi:hypothetical protein